MTEVASLGIKIDSKGVVIADKRLKGLTAQGDKAEKQAGHTGKSFTRMASTAAKLGGVLGAAAAVGLGAIIVNAAKSAKELDNLSKVAGTSATDLQRLSFASETVGIDVNKLSDILKDVNDKLGDFVQTGAGPMADFFEQIAPKVGITAEAFKDLSSADALQLYVSSLEKANLSQSDMTFYMEAIANDATALLPLLKDNGAEFQNLAKRAEDLGRGLSDIDIQELKKFDESVRDLSWAFEGFTNQVAIGATPAVNELIGILSDEETLKNAVGLGQSIAEGMVAAVNAINTTINVLGFLKDEFRAGVLGDIDEDDIGRLLDLKKNLEQSLINNTGIFDNGDAARKRLREVEARIEQWRDKFSTPLSVGVTSEIPETKPSKNSSVAPSSFASSALKDWRKELQFSEKTLGMTNAQIDIYKAKQLGATAADIKRLQALQNQNQTLEDSIEIQDEMDRLRESQVEQTSQLDDYIETLHDLEGTLEGGAINALKGLEDGFISLIKGTESVSDSFKNMANSIIDELIRIQIQQTITKPLAGLMGTAISGLFGAVTGGGGGQQAFNTMSFEGGGFTGSGTRSGGVDGRGGFPAILHPNETVVDHTKGQGMGGETIVVQQTINITTGIQQTVRNEISQMMPQIAAASKQAVLEARKRGGSFASTFGAS